MVKSRLNPEFRLLDELTGDVATKRNQKVTETHLDLLHGSQVVQLGVVDLLLKHQLLEVLSCVRLPLQRLQGL